MTTDDILRNNCDMRVGFQLSHISEVAMKPNEARSCGFRRLSRIPHKITAYLYRDKIKKAWKSIFTEMGVCYDYLVESDDGTVFHLEY